MMPFTQDTVIDLLEPSVRRLILNDRARSGSGEDDDKGATTAVAVAAAVGGSVDEFPRLLPPGSSEVAMSGADVCFERLVSAGFIVPRIHRNASSYNSFAKLSLLGASPGTSPCSTRSSDGEW